jgi:Tol biopolymer transport system component
VRTRKVFIALAAAAALVALAAMPASARPPGVNGQIAYGNDAGVFTANPDGSNPRLLVPNSCCQGWSWDGSKLAMGYGTQDGRIGTATINADGSGYTEFPIPDPTLNIGCSVWSPNDQRLACEGWNDSNPVQDGIYTISSADGGGLIRVTTNPLGAHDIPGSYSPDGKRIVFVRFDQNGNSAGLFTVRTDGTDLRQLMPASTILNIGADWSPQGNEIIFSQHVTPDVHGSLWVIHADGTGLHEIDVPALPCGGPDSDPNAYGCHAPHWSPDGTKITFAAGSPANGLDIYETNANGTGLTQVTHDGNDDNPTWGTHPPVG